MEGEELKIAIVAPLVTPITEPQLGGSQAILADLASGLAARGHAVDVFAASGSRIEGAKVVDLGISSADLAQTLFRVGERLASGPAVEAFSKVYEAVFAGDHDVIHNHAFDAPAITLAPDDRPVVHTLHLPPSEEIAGALAVIGTEASVVTVSEAMRRAWSLMTRVDVVIRNGVPVGRIATSDAREHLLFAGRLSPEKGAEVAIEIAKAAKMPITVVGGPYDESYAENITTQWSGDPDVELAGHKTRQEVWELMATSRAVLFPALWDEPFGLVAAEAQAAGSPVVAFDRGALREVVIDGETGFLVEGVDGAVEALRRIGEIDRSACRAHALANLSLDTTLDEHEALYERIGVLG